MNKSKLLKIGLLFFGILALNNAWASAYNDTMSVFSASLGLIFALCELTGVLFIGVGFVRWQQHRQNPSETPLSRVLYVLFFGLGMLILPYIAHKATINQTIETAAEQAS